jgi:hypothetical protein
MMIMTTRWIVVCRAGEGAVLAIEMTMTMARVRITCRAVRKVPEKAMDQTMGRGNRRGMGRETLKRKVL